MSSFIQPQETLDPATAGSISRLGSFVTTRALNQAAGVAEGLLLAPSGTAGQECISPSTAALVQSAVGFSVYRPMSEDFDSTHHYADNEAVAIMESGHMYVLAEGTVVAGQPVYARFVSDGGSNTILGKVLGGVSYPAGGIVLTPSGTFGAIVTELAITLSNGLVEETFTFTSDATPTAAEIAAGFVALIDASASYASTGTTTISVTSGTGVVEIVGTLPAGIVLTTGGQAARVPGTFFDASRTGAGLVEIRRIKIN
jgi:hypothetical protein